MEKEWISRPERTCCEGGAAARMGLRAFMGMNRMGHGLIVRDF